MQQNTVVAFQPSKTNPKDVTWASLFRADSEVSGELDGKVRAVDPAIAVSTELSSIFCPFISQVYRKGKAKSSRQ